MDWSVWERWRDGIEVRTLTVSGIRYPVAGTLGSGFWETDTGYEPRRSDTIALVDPAFLKDTRFSADTISSRLADTE